MVDPRELVRNPGRLFRGRLVTPRQALELTCAEPCKQFGHVADRQRRAPQRDRVLRFLREREHERVKIAERGRCLVAPSTVRELSSRVKEGKEGEERARPGISQETHMNRRERDKGTNLVPIRSATEVRFLTVRPKDWTSRFRAPLRSERHSPRQPAKQRRPLADEDEHSSLFSNANFVGNDPPARAPLGQRNTRRKEKKVTHGLTMSEWGTKLSSCNSISVPRDRFIVSDSGSREGRHIRTPSVCR